METTENVGKSLLTKSLKKNYVTDILTRAGFFIKKKKNPSFLAN
jgi:hypothetical protein